MRFSSSCRRVQHVEAVSEYSRSRGIDAFLVRAQVDSFKNVGDIAAAHRSALALSQMRVDFNALGRHSV